MPASKPLFLNFRAGFSRRQTIAGRVFSATCSGVPSTSKYRRLGRRGTSAPKGAPVGVLYGTAEAVPFQTRSPASQTRSARFETCSPAFKHAPRASNTLRSASLLRERRRRLLAQQRECALQSLLDRRVLFRRQLLVQPLQHGGARRMREGVLRVGDAVIGILRRHNEIHVLH